MGTGYVATRRRFDLWSHIGVFEYALSGFSANVNKTSRLDASR